MVWRTLHSVLFNYSINFLTVIPIKVRMMAKTQMKTKMPVPIKKCWGKLYNNCYLNHLLIKKKTV